MSEGERSGTDEASTLTSVDGAVGMQNVETVATRHHGVVVVRRATDLVIGDSHRKPASRTHSPLTISLDAMGTARISPSG